MLKEPQLSRLGFAPRRNSRGSKSRYGKKARGTFRNGGEGTHGRRQGHESEFGVNHDLEIGIENIQHTVAIAKLVAGTNEKLSGGKPEELETGRAMQILTRTLLFMRETLYLTRVYA